MAIKKINISDNGVDPPRAMGVLTFNEDSNGRYQLRDRLPKGITQETIKTICSELYIGMKSGTFGQFSWAE